MSSIQDMTFYKTSFSLKTCLEKINLSQNYLNLFVCLSFLFAICGAKILIKKMFWLKYDPCSKVSEVVLTKPIMSGWLKDVFRCILGMMEIVFQKAS